MRAALVKRACRHAASAVREVERVLFRYAECAKTSLQAVRRARDEMLLRDIMLRAPSLQNTPRRQRGVRCGVARRPFARVDNMPMVYESQEIGQLAGLTAAIQPRVCSTV